MSAGGPPGFADAHSPKARSLPQTVSPVLFPKRFRQELLEFAHLAVGELSHDATPPKGCPQGLKSTRICHWAPRRERPFRTQSGHSQPGAWAREVPSL
ncbi:hypothetical protein THIOKS12070028 [Thiocapsa sp. KS1]|nr:hypothetical protein THIOKS12070028 [Thiocapsa sp. KS1]